MVIKLRVAMVFAVAAALTAWGLAACVGDEPVVANGDAGTDSPTGADATGADANGSDAIGADGGVDSSPGTDANVDAADARAWSPGDLGAKLVLWLEAAPAQLEVAAGRVAAWHDRSSFAATAAPPAGAGGPAAPPDAGSVNGAPVVGFDSNTILLTVADAQQFHWGTRDFLVLAVVRDGTSGGASMSLWSRSESAFGHTGALSFSIGGSGFLHMLVRGDGDAAIDQFDSTNPVMADKAYHLVGMRRLPQDKIEIRVDGTPQQFALTPVNLDLANANDTRLGGSVNPPVVRDWDVEIAELVAVSSTSGVVTDGDVTSVETYLKTKYATP